MCVQLDNNFIRLKDVIRITWSHAGDEYFIELYYSYRENPHIIKCKDKDTRDRWVGMI